MGIVWWESSGFYEGMPLLASLSNEKFKLMVKMDIKIMKECNFLTKDTDNWLDKSNFACALDDNDIKVWVYMHTASVFCLSVQLIHFQRALNVRKSFPKFRGAHEGIIMNS